MFTGIVELVGTVASLEEREAGRRLVVSAPGIGAVAPGASIAVNGVCLTALGTEEDHLAFDVIPETLDRSNLGALSVGGKVNLERPMPAQGRFDGHIVQGHVDGVGIVTSLETTADGGTVMGVEVPSPLRHYLVEKGSITIDGVSLTVAALTGDGCTVALIPHTLEVTNLGLRKSGDQVNLEVDVLAKYVERLLKVLR